MQLTSGKTVADIVRHIKDIQTITECLEVWQSGFYRRSNSHTVVYIWWCWQPCTA